MANKRKNKRRRHLIDKDFQIKFALKFCIMLVIGAILSTGILFAFTSGTLTTSYEGAGIRIEKTSKGILPAILYTNAITVASISLAAIVVLIFISHKIVGPFYRFGKTLEEISNGNLSLRIRLREKDQFLGIAEKINQMNEQLNDRILGLKKKATRVRSELDQDSPNLTVLRRESETLLKALEEFKTVSNGPQRNR
ncbi:MAG: methyl-accepting chemotaxis protein [Desulfobacterales bacterium]|nr:methyl-accepting chemotaxis protein [Desulfobacterales bacterium]